MPRRFGRPGLVGTMARTAVVAGTANATVGAMNRRQAGKQQAAYEQQAAQQAAFESQAQMAEMQAQLNAMQAQQAPPPPPAAPAAPAAAAAGGDLMTELQKLADMKAAGILTDDEFAAAKAKLLA
ncbi:MAG: SHOCT domain-containing protein [Ilumatobacter sp.]|nr:SHOCT domain-containing protein [Ilumatobacter sp.]